MRWKLPILAGFAMSARLLVRWAPLSFVLSLPAGPVMAQPLPPLPTPAVNPNAPPPVFLEQARRDLVAGRSGAALEALERAETRVLERLAIQGRPVGPSGNPFIVGIGNARRAVQAGDRAGAERIIDELLARTHMVH